MLGFKKERKQENNFPKLTRDYGFLGFTGPALLFLGTVLIFPLIYTLFKSLYQWNLTDPSLNGFVGLGNYIKLFTSSEFWHALYLHFSFMIISVSLELLIGLGVALFLNRKFFAANVVRALLLLPVFILPVVSGLTFRFMYNPQYGAINWFLHFFGLGPVAFLSNPSTAFVAIVIQDVWRMWPFMFMIIYAGLASLPTEPFEAALIDGANSWQKFWYVTLPLLKPTIIVAIMLRIIDVLKAFSEIFVMTSGGPGNATTLLSIYIYKNAFKFFKMGYSSSISYILVIIALIIAVVLVRNIYTEEEV